MRLYKLASEQKDADAQFNLGSMYDHSQGSTQNSTQALHWYKLAAAQGDKSARNNLGYMYGKGEGIQKNEVQAYVWFDLAASQGDTDAVKNRELMATTVSPQQLVQAKKLTRQCLASGFTRCDEKPVTNQP